jgi:hypothetical protein
MKGRTISFLGPTLIVWIGFSFLSSCAQLPAIPPTDTALPTTSPAPSESTQPTAIASSTLKPVATPTDTPHSTETQIPPTLTLTTELTATSTALPFASGPVTIGTSVAGRPLQAYRFGTGPRKKLIVYGIHGGSEYNTIDLGNATIKELTAHPERIPIDLTLFIVPDVNPDGEQRAHGPDGRANDHGVDLNRNWNYLWKPDWKRPGCWNVLPISAGGYPLSEPEAQALWRLITAHSFEAMISYHSAAMGILPAGQPLDPPSVRLAKAVAAVTDRDDYPYPPLNTGCEYTGQLSDWAASIGVPFIDLELPTLWNPDFAASMKVLQAFLSWRK